MTDKEAWQVYIERKSKKFGITTSDVLKIIGYCFGNRVNYYINTQQCTVLLDGLPNLEVNKALKRMKKQVNNLDKLIKLRKESSEEDLDFILYGGNKVRTPHATITFNLLPSEINYV